jgi:hypothetical protein
MDQWRHYKEDLSSGFEKPTANGNTYSRAGTAELKQYSRNAKKFCKNLEYYFTFTAEK